MHGLLLLAMSGGGPIGNRLPTPLGNNLIPFGGLRPIIQSDKAKWGELMITKVSIVNKVIL